MIVSGIWPPDVGGPASHAPELASWLRARGHQVEVRDDRGRAAGAERLPRALGVAPPAARASRHARRRSRLVATRARRADVVYATHDRPLARREPRSRDVRSSSSSPPTRRSNALAARGS